MYLLCSRSITTTYAHKDHTFGPLDRLSETNFKEKTCHQFQSGSSPKKKKKRTKNYYEDLRAHFGANGGTDDVSRNVREAEEAAAAAVEVHNSK